MIPKKIRIQGEDVKVIMVKRFASDKPNTWGRTKFAQNEILIAKRDKYGNKISRDGINNTFIHEILHHISEKYGVDLKEDQVNKTANGFFQVLKDNKLRFDK